MKSKLYKTCEFFIIFILLPVSFIFPYAVYVKLGLGVVGFAYVIYMLLKIENQEFTINKHLNWYKFWKVTLLKFFVIAVLTTFFVYITNKSLLFQVVLNKPKMWLVILFVYSLFSVYPQELLYRTFFHVRYSDLVSNTKGLIFINALVFSLGHIFFKNALVLLFTFIGGLLFAITFVKTKSTVLVSVEHAIYGCWLFTVGLGEMLGFPT
ncbi:CPBP family intramembrane metalloprotease [Tamlana sp. 62-3]|uniref:CPBP family intramembrane metalloprotease n=1 Tax=Neotamlana sargassicola TaxID=2883125 RepID=A0A9X1L8L1_9FLAO|nr:CPBP family intramembrane glutamic endopeptidase [Tamlana sargassicola]MCB4808983.1 CPBP family intramembrane metalloprotease [Tamlana sargassicola]